jgi:hypothetical protein
MSRRKRSHHAKTGRTSARPGRTRTRALVIVLTLAVAGIAATAWLTHAQEPTRVTTSGTSGAGQRAFIDPTTGQLRQPEHDELAAIAAAAAAAPAKRLARTASVTQEMYGPDGSVEAVVPEDLHTFTVATRGPDGRIKIEHAQGVQNAVKVMNANTAKQGTQGKEDRNDR